MSETLLQTNGKYYIEGRAPLLIKTDINDFTLATPEYVDV